MSMNRNALRNLEKYFVKSSFRFFCLSVFFLIFLTACTPPATAAIPTNTIGTSPPTKTSTSLPTLTLTLSPEAESLPANWKEIDIDLAKLHYQQLTGISFDEGYKNYLRNQSYYSSEGLDENKSYGEIYFTPMLVSYTTVSLAPITDNPNDMGLLLILAIDNIGDQSPIFFGGLVWYKLGKETKSINFYDITLGTDSTLSPKTYSTLADIEQRLNNDILSQTYQLSKNTDSYFKMGVLLRFADTNINWNDFHDKGLMWDPYFENGLLKFKDVMQYYLSKNTYLRTNSTKARVTYFDETTSFGRQPGDLELFDDSISFITNGDGLDIGLILLEFIAFPEV